MGAEARRITPEAFQMLQEQVEGCEPLEDADLCLQCLVSRMQGFADAHQVRCTASTPP